MSRIKTFLAYSWAFLAAPLVLATFMGMDSFAGKLVAVTGLHVHPIYTGGEIARTIDHGSYQTLIHEPVFDGLIGRRKHGFVQIEWQPKDANLPERIDEPIDFDADGPGEFAIHLDTKTNDAGIKPLDRCVLSLGEVLTIGNARMVRVNLKAP
jgi:hypothetical protein